MKKNFEKTAREVQGLIINKIDNKWTCQKITRLLKPLGFKKKRNQLVWINKKDKLVIKIPYILGNKPLNSIPTYDFAIDRDESIFIQPLADTSSKRAKEKMRKIWEGNFSQIKAAYGQDLAERNLGVYRGEVVALDW